MTPEPDPLTNAYWKTERAKLHLDALAEAVNTFCADSYSITSHEEPERDQVRYRIETKQPHVSIYLICGDVLQCLRTALDQAVWSLIYHRTGEDRGDSEFPIFVEQPNSEGRRKFQRKIDGLSSPAIAYIESIQPYNRPAGDNLATNALWCLHELNRIDKHRRISVRPQFEFAGRMWFGAGHPRADFAAMTSERTDYGYEILCAGSYKYLQPHLTSLVVFGEEKAGMFLTIRDIWNIYNFVTDEVLVSLAGFAIKNN